MAQLSDCANEMLLAIGAYLDTNSLLSLVHTCSSLRPIAQEVLFRSPSVPCSTSESASRLACLLRIFLERPDLAARVRKLEWSPFLKLVEFDAAWSPGEQSKSSKHPVSKCTTKLSEKSSFTGPGAEICWSSRTDVQPRMWEISIAAEIIKRAPKLVDLALLPTGPTGTPMSMRFLEKLHSRGDLSGEVDISTLLPYQNLKELRIASPVFDHKLLSLPNLESLSIGGHEGPYSSENGPPSATPKVTQPVRNRQLDEFLSVFPNLAHLRINLHQTRWSASGFGFGFGEWNFAAVVSRIARVKLGLETLDLSIFATPEGEWSMNETRLSEALPCSSLASFPKLRGLKLPQTALPRTRFSPKTLEVLEVHRVKADILEWIKCTLENRTRFPNLRRIDLCPNENQHVDLEDLKAVYKRYRYMEQLPRLGIKLRVWWNETEHVAKWKQKQRCS